MIPGIYVSKTSAYGVLGTPKGISASKTAAFAVLYPRLGYPASVSGFPVLDSSTKGRHISAYSGSVAAYPGLSSSTRENVKYLYPGSISAYPGLSSASYGKHQWFVRGDIPAYPKLASHTYNVLHPKSTPGHPGLIDLITALDPVDYGFYAGDPGGMGIQEFQRGKFYLDTTKYDGTCAYYLEIIATNTGSLVDSVVTITGPGVTATLTIPAGTIEPTRFRVPIAPTGAGYVYWTVSDLQLMVVTGRIVVYQQLATKTVLWRPLIDYTDNFAGHFHRQIGNAWVFPADTDWVRIGGTFRYDASINSAGSITVMFEAVCGGSYGDVLTGHCLWDLTDDVMVPGSYMQVNGQGFFGGTAPWVNSVTFPVQVLQDGHLYTPMWKWIAGHWLAGGKYFRSCLYWILSGGIDKCEVVWRVGKQYGGAFPSACGASRAKVENLGGNAELVYVKNETCTIITDGVSATHWITNDGHNQKGYGDTAVNVTNSDITAAFADFSGITYPLPYRSGDFKTHFVSGDMYCCRGVPLPASGSYTGAMWTLICLGYRPVDSGNPSQCFEDVPQCEPWMAEECTDPSYEDVPSCDEPGLVYECTDPSYEDQPNDGPCFEDANQ